LKLPATPANPQTLQQSANT